MDAPNKIWVTTSEMTALLSERRHDYDVAYIRKDALLKWAKEKQEQMKIEAGGCSNMLAAGKYLAYSELIEKIESL